MTTYRYPWHAPLWEKMEAYFNKDRFPHAILFWGTKGLGKHDFVKELTARLLCLKQTGESCGECQSCHWLSKHTHPDELILTPEAGKQIIPVDKIRSLSDKINRTSLAGRGIVVSVSLTEYMNREAQNALLKLLEEPPPKVFFLLVSEQAALLPQTIRSRCQSFYFPVQTPESVAAYLSAKGIEEAHAFLLKGAPLLSSHRCSDGYLSLRKMSHQALMALQSSGGCPIMTASTWQKAPINDLIEILLDWISDVLKMKLIKDTARVVNQDSIATLKSYANMMETSKIIAVLDKIMALKKRLLTKSNINKQLWLEDLAIALV